MKGLFVEIRDDRDGPDRDFCQTNAVILADDADPVACVIVDISPSGAKLVVDADRQIPHGFKLLVPADRDLDEHYNCEVRWRAGNNVGVKFVL